MKEKNEQTIGGETIFGEDVYEQMKSKGFNVTIINLMREITIACILFDKANDLRQKLVNAFTYTSLCRVYNSVCVDLGIEQPAMRNLLVELSKLMLSTSDSGFPGEETGSPNKETLH